MSLVSPGRKVNQQGEREGKTEQNVILKFPSRHRDKCGYPKENRNLLDSCYCLTQWEMELAIVTKRLQLEKLSSLL